jgi:hypothetical protein
MGPYFSKLPNESVLDILTRVQEPTNTSLVCRKFHEISSTNQVYEEQTKVFYRDLFSDEEKAYGISSAREFYHENIDEITGAMPTKNENEIIQLLTVFYTLLVPFGNRTDKAEFIERIKQNRLFTKESYLELKKNILRNFKIEFYHNYFLGWKSRGIFERIQQSDNPELKDLQESMQIFERQLKAQTKGERIMPLVVMGSLYSVAAVASKFLPYRDVLAPLVFSLVNLSGFNLSSPMYIKKPIIEEIYCSFLPLIAAIGSKIYGIEGLLTAFSITVGIFAPAKLLKVFSKEMFVLTASIMGYTLDLPMLPHYLISLYYALKNSNDAAYGHITSAGKRCGCYLVNTQVKISKAYRHARRLLFG